MGCQTSAQRLPEPVPQRELGGTGLHVGGLGMGCARLGAFWQGRSWGDAVRSVRVAMDGGVTFFDTADVYARGIAERALGVAIRGRRDEVVICAKVGFLKTPLAVASAVAARHRQGEPVDAVRLMAGIGRDAGQCFLPSYIRRSAEQSLRRLGTDHIDLFLLHSPTLEVIRDGGFVSGLEDLRAAGKIRHWGVSCLGLQHALQALDLPGLACIQIPYNLSDTSCMEAAAKAGARNVGVVARSPFGDGELLRSLGATHDAMQACLQFVLSQPAISVVLAGMSHPGHVVRNLELVTADPLTDARLGDYARQAREEAGC